MSKRRPSPVVMNVAQVAPAFGYGGLGPPVHRERRASARRSNRGRRVRRVPRPFNHGRGDGGGLWQRLTAGPAFSVAGPSTPTTRLKPLAASNAVRNATGREPRRAMQQRRSLGISARASVAERSWHRGPAKTATSFSVLMPKFTPLEAVPDVEGGRPCAHCLRLFISTPKRKFCGSPCRVAHHKAKQAVTLDDNVQLDAVGEL